MFLGRGGGISAGDLRQQLKDDFDLESSNATFDKDALMAEIEAERQKLRSEGLSLASPCVVLSLIGLVVDDAPAYNPSVSIFDTLSSESVGGEVCCFLSLLCSF